MGQERRYRANQNFSVEGIGQLTEGHTYDLDVAEWSEYLHDDKFFTEVPAVPEPPEPQVDEGDADDDGVT